MQQPHYVTETQILRKTLANPECRYIWTAHAQEVMAERNISAADIEHALMTGHVTLEEKKKDILWRVEGTDIDGRTLEVVVAVFSDVVVIKVVTAF